MLLASISISILMSVHSVPCHERRALGSRIISLVDSAITPGRTRAYTCAYRHDGLGEPQGKLVPLNVSADPAYRCYVELDLEMIPPVGGLAASISTLESWGCRFEPRPSE